MNTYLTLSFLQTYFFIGLIIILMLIIIYQFIKIKRQLIFSNEILKKLNDVQKVKDIYWEETLFYKIRMPFIDTYIEVLEEMHYKSLSQNDIVIAQVQKNMFLFLRYIIKNDFKKEHTNIPITEKTIYSSFNELLVGMIKNKRKEIIKGKLELFFKEYNSAK